MGRDDLYITVPSLFRCPISLDVMKSPVSLCTGVTYDRASIQRWLDGGNNTCPATMQVLHSKDLVPNHTLQRLIQIWSDSVRRRSIPGEAAVSSLKQEHLPELVTEIEKMSEQCSECVSRIACFAQESEEKLKFLARVPGFVPALVNILNKRRGDAARENFDLAVKVVRLLDMVAKEYEDKEELMRLTLKGDRDCLSSLLFVLQRGSTESKVGCVRILETIAIDAESKLQIAGKDGLLSELLALVGTESTDQTIIEAGLSCLIAISMPKRIRSQIVSLGAIKLRRESRDLRGPEMRGGDSAEGDEGVERGDGACGYDSVEHMLPVSGSKGSRGGDEEQWANQDLAVDAEQLLGGGETNGRGFAEDFQSELQVLSFQL
ncbi:U-box domain-containing protein 27-like isoform X2 [Malania oleifera]|uniref:U-box domain-containing protein 27-like isoform X2 n=1 Tax=Malania oleifera TaxID=397392 RepID=UPI0025AE5191|nr:U-box domain-containing protein 27-like isoform X2 [Malania oleifera]